MFSSSGLQRTHSSVVPSEGVCVFVCAIGSSSSGSDDQRQENEQKSSMRMKRWKYLLRGKRTGGVDYDWMELMARGWWSRHRTKIEHNQGVKQPKSATIKRENNKPRFGGKFRWRVGPSPVWEKQNGNANGGGKFWDGSLGLNYSVVLFCCGYCFGRVCFVSRKRNGIILHSLSRHRTGWDAGFVDLANLRGCCFSSNHLLVRNATYHCGHLAGQHWLSRWNTHLLHDGVLQGQMIPSVYQQLIFEMLWRVEVFTRWFFTITTTLWKREGKGFC